MAKEKKFDPDKTIFLIDGSSFLYRAYYGLRPLHTSKGVPVQAVYSFCRMIRKLISKFGAKYIALIWDSKGKTTRHDMYKDYKATRQSPPSDIFDQKKLIVEIADTINMCQLAQRGIEADDIIFSVAQDFKEKDYNIVVVTLDKDLGQMLDEHVFMYDAFKDLVTDVPVFEEKMGFEIAKLPFYFALLGDTSDNIPGVRGIGKKGALELVNQFSSLKELYDNLDRVARPRVKKALQANKDNAFLSEALFLLQNVETDVTEDDLLFDVKHWIKARDIFQELEFKTLLKEIDKDKQFASERVKAKLEKLEKHTFICVQNETQLKQLCYELKHSSAFALDTETDGLRPLQCNCIGISVCMKEGVSYYIPFGHKVDEEQLTKEQILLFLKPIFENKTIGKYLHNAKFDQLVLYQMGIELQGVTFDSLIAARLVAKEWQRNSLKKLSMKYFNEPMLTFEEVVKANKYKDFSYVPFALATKYAAADAHQTLKLTKVLKKELKEEKMQQLFDEVEFPLIQILYEMEKAGIFVDANKLKRLGKKLEKKLLTIEQKIISVVGIQYAGINLNSPKQVEELLFTHLKLPPQKRSAKGTGYSTDQEVLRKLSTLHVVPGLILKYREYAKLKTTYVDALPGYINSDTGRVHTTFNQTDVATGRLSSSDPNLQNIPTDGSELGSQIRESFLPKKGNVFLSADYSQIELRVLAHLSGDKSLINAFLQNRDIHAEIASKIFNVSFERVTHEQRQVGKRINFSILYGITPYGLSKGLGIKPSEAKKYIEAYFSQYPKVSEWMMSVVEETKNRGYVETFYGRRRYVPGIYEKNKNLYELAKRVAINTRAQGTAADIMKKGMIDVNSVLTEKNINAQMLLQIHDELLVSIAKKQKDETGKIIKQALESVVDWEVPLKVVVRLGANWSDATK